MRTVFSRPYKLPVLNQIRSIVFLLTLLILQSACTNEKARDALEAKYAALETLRLQELAEQEKKHKAALRMPIENASTPQASAPWRLASYPDPSSGAATCALLSASHLVMNDSLATQVQVVVTVNRIFLRTDATLNTTNPEAGFRVDAGIPIPFDSQLNEVTALVDKNYDRLISLLSVGSFLEASFAYDPQNSADDTFRVEFVMDKFSLLLNELASCSLSVNSD